MCVVGGLPSALAEMKQAGIFVVGLDDAAEKSIFEIGEVAKESICLVLVVDVVDIIIYQDRQMAEQEYLFQYFS